MYSLNTINDMKFGFISLLVVLFAFQGVAQGQSRAQAQALAFTHVTVLDMKGRPAMSNMTVVVDGNRIRTIQKSKQAKLSKGTKVVDATGKFLLPGLWDMHVHALRQQGYNTDNFFSLFIANGVTGVREMGNSPLSITEVQQQRQEIETGKRPGPRFFMCGPLLDGRSSLWKSTVVVTTEQAGRAAVDSLKKAGVDFIKVYSGLSAPVYFAIADEAKKQGIPFVGHIPQAVTAREASNAGQKSIEHLGEGELLLACSAMEESARLERSKLSAIKPGSPEWKDQWISYNQLLLNTYSEEQAKELLALLGKNTTWQCPTLIGTFAAFYVIEASRASEDKLKYLSTSVKEFWTQMTEFRKKINPASIQVLKKHYQLNVQLVGAMNKAGVPLLAGTDELTPHVVPGFSLHEELRLLVEAGLSPLAALQAATLNPAKYFGLTDALGTVEEGKLADLLLLDANPLEDISNTKTIAAVVANGRYFSRQELDQLLEAAQVVAGK
jgi:imidazolonepropionase-like amidohydrolase